MLGTGLCGLQSDLELDRRVSINAEISQTQVEFTARHTIFRQNEIFDSIPVICDGWAATILKLSNGRRQILSFLLPGEMITCRLLFDPQLHISVDSITDGCYRTYDRSQLRSIMSGSQNIFDRFLSVYSDEDRRGDQLIATLGQRTAYERVACLLLDLWDRLEKSNKVTANRVEFPLRQTHVADATGLTPVYVSRVLNEFRDDGIIEISDRHLHIFDMEKLRRLAA